MSLKSCEKVETNVYELEISLEGEAFKAAVSKAYAKNKGKYNVPGFRKGKAPKHVIETYYGKEVFFYDAVDAEYPALFEAAVKEAGIVPVDAPFDDKLENVSEDGFTVKLKVTVKPEADVKLYKGITAEKEKVTVKKSEIKDEVNKALEKDAKMVTIEGKAAKKGDTANIDFEGFVDDKAFEGGKGEGYDLELGSGTFIPGFEEQVIGHKTGDEFDVNVTFPEEYGAKELAGKPAVFKVKLNKIMKKELPVYDDEFVKDVSEFDTVADYEKHLEEEIKERKEHAAERTFEDAVVDILIENTVVEIPDAMIEKEIDNQLNEFNYRLNMQGMNLDMYMQYLGTDAKGLRDSYRANAEKSVKLRLALEKIIKLENIEISDEDVEAELKSYADTYQMELDRVKSLVSAEDVREDLACRKAMELVKSAAVEGKKKVPAKKKAESSDADEKPEKKAPAKKSTAKKKASESEAE
ncbi:MAG: trigger factor [Oscillospiraceae bacterium]|nr:trigger factor [Oscillospiraceae bacterium]MDD7471056.1 trigger factor [Oscillospiraceae bacterium]MDY2678393.1 trigger factor [Oscillospiraceae bacterium]